MTMPRRFLPSLLWVCLLGNAIVPLAAARNGDTPSLGTSAPPFRLQDQNGVWHDLKQYQGKWVVLYFYPKDETPGCTTEACEFRDNIFAFRQAGAVLLGVSVDDVSSHRKFAEKHSLPFPLLADVEKTVAKNYAVLYKAMGILEVARRETFIIDPTGRIAKHYSNVNPKSHADAVLADLRILARSGA